VGGNSFGALEVEPEQHTIIDKMDATTGWAALGNDTLNLATTTNHVIGSNALTFDKVDGAANTVFAGIEKTLTSLDFGNVSPHDIIQTSCYISDNTNVSYVFVRLGTDSSNYNEWRIDGANLDALDWKTLIFNLGDASQAGNTGNGWNATAVTYAAIGLAFNSESDTLAGIIFDQISFHTNIHTSSAINSEVTSSVNSSNVNIHKIGNKVVNTEAGNVGTGTQRITIATDDANLASINTDAGTIASDTTNILADTANMDTNLGAIAGAVSGSEMQVDVITMPSNLDVTPAAPAAGDYLPVRLTDGTSFISETTELDVNLQDGAGTDLTSSLINSNQTLDTNVTGDVAHDAADAGYPIKIGGKASSDYGTSDDVADQDRTDAIFTLAGAQTVMPYAIPEEFVHGNATLTTTSNTSVIAAPGTNLTTYITSVAGSNTDPDTGVRVDLKDGTTIKMSFFCAASGGGFSHQMPVPLQLTANTAFQAASSATVSDVRVTAQGFVLPH
jgi:hypothetical protein